jgi:hypothetical protein
VRYKVKQKMREFMKTDRQLKIAATKKEEKRVFDNFLKPSDIFVKCSDGYWEKTFWVNGSKFGWNNWKKAHPSDYTLIDIILSQ